MDRKASMKKVKLGLIFFVNIALITSLFSFVSLSGCKPTAIGAEETEKEKEKVKQKPMSVAEQLDNRSEPEPELSKAALTYVELGLGYMNQGQMARAKSKLTHALKIGPELTETHSAMAHFLEKTGNIKDAEKEHRKALRLAKLCGAVQNNYGAFLCRQGRFKEADDAFQRALTDKEYARTAEINENAGICALKAQDLAAAASYLTTTLQQDPKRTNAMLELADLQLQQGNLAEARHYFVQYKQNADPTARSLWIGIRIAQKLNDQDSIASQALMLKNLFEDSREYQLFLNSEIPKPS